MARKKRHAQPPKETESRSNMLLAILILIAVALGFYVWRTSMKGAPLPGKEPGVTEVTATPTPNVSPTPTRLRQGMETYTIGQAANEPGPKIQQLTLNPHEPKQGVSQTISVKVSHTAAVQSVTIDLQTDSKNRTVTLTLSQGTNLDGTWQTTWIADDSLLYVYKYTITVQAGSQSSSVIVAPRS